MICPRCLYDVGTPEKGYAMNYCRECGFVWTMTERGIDGYLNGGAEKPDRKRVDIPEGALPVFFETEAG